MQLKIRTEGTHVSKKLNSSSNKAVQYFEETSKRTYLALNVERLFQRWRVELESIQRTERDVVV
jgi:hypothetical protein